MTAEAQEPDATAAVRELVRRTLTEIVDLSDPEGADLAETTPLESLGVDSLARAELAVVVELELGIAIPDGQLAGMTTVGDVTTYLTAERNGPDRDRA